MANIQYGPVVFDHTVHSYTLNDVLEHLKPLDGEAVDVEHVVMVENLGKGITGDSGILRVEDNGISLEGEVSNPPLVDRLMKANCDELPILYSIVFRQKERPF